MSDYWTENGIEKPQRIVVCAACFLSHAQPMLVGPRHWDAVMRKQFDRIRGNASRPSSHWQQGFIDQFGDFMDRKEAFEVVKASGQPLNMERNGSETELYSEGLY